MSYQEIEVEIFKDMEVQTDFNIIVPNGTSVIIS